MHACAACGRAYQTRKTHKTHNGFCITTDKMIFILEFAQFTRAHDCKSCMQCIANVHIHFVHNLRSLRCLSRLPFSLWWWKHLIDWRRCTGLNAWNRFRTFRSICKHNNDRQRCGFLLLFLIMASWAWRLLDDWVSIWNWTAENLSPSQKKHMPHEFYKLKLFQWRHGDKLWVDWLYFDVDWILTCNKWLKECLKTDWKRYQKNSRLQIRKFPILN